MAADKIKVANPVVDLDGDEMTRYVVGGAHCFAAVGFRLKCSTDAFALRWTIWLEPDPHSAPTTCV